MSTQRIAIFHVLFFFVFQGFSQTIRYVNSSSNGIGDGSSWQNASSDLQAIINFSKANDQIWVKEGIYMPLKDASGNLNPINPKNKAFFMKDSIQIYGGFNGTENLLLQRDFGNYSVLSGDIGVLNDSTDNCFHILISLNNSSATLIDGFKFEKGNSFDPSFRDIEINGIWVENYMGSAIFNRKSDLNISNCFFENNYGYFGTLLNHESNNKISNCRFAKNHSSFGAGLINWSSHTINENLEFYNNFGVYAGSIYNVNGGEILIKNSIFKNNFANKGGAIHNAASDPKIDSCVFENNQANLGGAIYCEQSEEIVSNCFFTNNHASLGGGAIYIIYSEIELIYNSVFANNIANSYGGAIYLNQYGTLNLYNCDLVKNQSTIGSAGFIYFSSFKAQNSIFWDNISTSGGAAIESYTSLFYNNCIMQDTTIGLNNIYSDPFFLNINDIDGLDNKYFTNDDGLNLLSNSPCINNSVNLPFVAKYDIRGVLRNGQSDIGAYEFKYPCNFLIHLESPNYDFNKFDNYYKSNSQIDARNLNLLASKVILESNKSILLLPGFLSQPNNEGSFKAEVANCIDE